MEQFVNCLNYKFKKLLTYFILAVFYSVYILYMQSAKYLLSKHGLNAIDFSNSFDIGHKL